VEKYFQKFKQCNAYVSNLSRYYQNYFSSHEPPIFSILASAWLFVSSSHPASSKCIPLAINPNALVLPWCFPTLRVHAVGALSQVLMLFAHHTPASAKQALVHEQGLVLPHMPAYAPSKHAAAPVEHQAVYASSYTCQSGHGMTSATVNGSDHVLPHWPAEVT